MALAVVVSLGPIGPGAAVEAGPTAPTQDPVSSTTTTVRRSGDATIDTSDSQVRSIVVALIAIAVLLTACTVVFWRMTRPGAVDADEVLDRPTS